VRKVSDAEQTQLIMQVLIRKPITSAAADFMLDAQPSTQPSRDTTFDGRRRLK
jgi:hypothetical protein